MYYRKLILFMWQHWEKNYILHFIWDIFKVGSFLVDMSYCNNFTTLIITFIVVWKIHTLNMIHGFWHWIIFSYFLIWDKIIIVFGYSLNIINCWKYTKLFKTTLQYTKWNFIVNWITRFIFSEFICMKLNIDEQLV